MENNTTDSTQTIDAQTLSDTSHPSWKNDGKSADLLTSELMLQIRYDELESCFLMKNYPPFCQKINYYIQKYLDSQDYDTSPIYDMYPSRAALDNMTDIIYLEMTDDSPSILKEIALISNFRYTNRTSLYLLIHPLLLNELYRRRMRKYIYTLCCCPPRI